MYQLLRCRHQIFIPEDTIQTGIEIVRTKGEGLGVTHRTRCQQRQLLHQQRVMIRGHIERVEHQVTAYLIGLRTAHIDRQVKARDELLVGNRLHVEMVTAQVEVQLRILLTEVHHAVERHRYMRIIDEELSAVSIGIVMSVYMQVAIGVVPIGQFTHMRFDISSHHTGVYTPRRLHIHRHRTQLRMIDHTSQLEPFSFHLGPVRHMLQDRVGTERTVRGDRTERRAESAMQRQVLQTTLRQTSITNRT